MTNAKLDNDAALRARTVSLHDAIEFIAQRGDVATQSSNTVHREGVINQIRGVIWLFTGKDPGFHTLNHFCDALDVLGVPYRIERHAEGPPTIWYGDDFTKAETDAGR